MCNDVVSQLRAAREGGMEWTGQWLCASTGSLYVGGHQSQQLV